MIHYGFFLPLLLGSMLLCSMNEASAQVVRYQGPDGRLYFTNLPEPRKGIALPAAIRQQWTQETFPRYCTELAKLAHLAAIGRDKGITLKEQLAILDTHPKMPIYNDYYRLIFLELHARSWESPPKTQHRVKTECVAAFLQ